MAELDLDEITVGYDDEGTGEPLVLVHGHPFDRSMWRPQARRFSRSGWRVIVPDLRGYGTSTVVPGSTTLERFARDLAGLLDQLGLDQVVLGGLSMGGQIVMEFHRLFPERIRALLLAATSPRAETPAGKQSRYELADRLHPDGMAAYADELLPKMVRPDNVAAAEHVLDMMRRTAPDGAAAAVRGRAERPSYVESLGTVAVPALVVVGRDDEFTPVDEARFLHAAVPGAELVIIEGAAHLPNLERPEEFNAALEQFLSRVPATSHRPAAGRRP